MNSDADLLSSLLMRLKGGFEGEESPAASDDVPDLAEEADEEPTRGGGAAVRRLHLEEGADDASTGLHRFDFRVGARTDPGTKVSHNEDAMLVGDGLFAVADGMGGHAGGEIASQLAVEALGRTFADDKPIPLLMQNLAPQATKLVQSIAAANEAVRSVAIRTPWLNEMGTTLVTLRLDPAEGRAYVAHVGDSRCYRLRNGKLDQLTRDHTMAEYGFSGKDARRLSRAVGSNGIVEADVAVLLPRDGDVFLLCSDGLTKTLTEEMIVETLEEEPDPDTAARALVDGARTLQARDNVTVVVVRVVAPVKR